MATHVDIDVEFDESKDLTLSLFLYLEIKLTSGSTSKPLVDPHREILFNRFI